MSEPRTIHAYAAPGAGKPVEPFNFEAPALGPTDVEIKISHCGKCTVDSGLWHYRSRHACHIDGLKITYVRQRLFTQESHLNNLCGARAVSNRAGICHSDVHLNDGDWGPFSQYPQVSGHELVGIVENVGSAVKQ